MDNRNISLGMNVIGLMHHRGMGMNELARATGVSSATISKLKNTPEEANPTLSVIRDLADKLGVEAWMLLAFPAPIEPIQKGGHLKEVSHAGYAMLKEFENATDETKGRAMQHLRFLLEADEGKRDAAKRLLDAQDEHLGKNT